MSPAAASAAPPPSFLHPRIERRSLRLADLAPEALRSLIAELNERADEIGCVILRQEATDTTADGAASDQVVVIFAGNLERFHMLAAARHLRCPVIYFQDVESWWYQGSSLLPSLEIICAHVLVPEVGAARALLFGQSSGAYAALAASTHLSGSTVVACAPQTFSDAGAKGAIHFTGVRALSTPDGLLDLRALLAARPDPDALRAVVIAAGESDNPVSAHYWMDYLHVLRLLDVPDVHLSIVDARSHVIVHQRLNRFAVLLRDLAGRMAAPPAERHAVLRAFLDETFGPATPSPS